MRVLLIEDETAHCEKYAECAEHMPYAVELSVANGYKEAVSFIEKDIFDVIFLDLEFNDSDENGILFLQHVHGLKNSPYIIVITKNCSVKTHNIVRSSGADFIFMKTKPDYSPGLIFDFAYQCVKNQPKPEQEPNGLEEIISREVEKLGFTYSMGGKNYLIEAISTVIHLGKSNPSLKKEVYPVVARKYKKTDWNVERGIRNAIIKTWRITDLDTLQENYTSNIDYGTGFPTNKEMIIFLAEKVKKEYAGHG